MMHHKPNKGLSQVFLVRPSYLEKIASDIEPAHTIIEIGPGRGELTGYLKHKAQKLVLIEIDSGLITLLKKEFADFPHISFVNKDVLNVDLNEFVSGQNKISIVGNLPYHISFKLIEYFARYKQHIHAVHASFQKEFSQKLIAEPSSKEYAYITCFFRYHFNPVKHFVIPKTAFYPMPNIDTMFVKFLSHDAYALDRDTETFFLKLVRNAFLYRRKKISNAMSGYVDKESIEKVLEKAGIDPCSRPDTISVEKYVHLTQLLKSQPTTTS